MIGVRGRQQAWSFLASVNVNCQKGMLPVLTTPFRARARVVLTYAAGAVPTARELRRLVMFCPPRSGSELLVSLLDGHPEVRCEGELFKHPRPYPFRYLEGKAKLAALRGHRVWGCKLLFQQLRWWATAFGSAREFLNRLHEAGYTFVVLDRRNLLLQALSLVHAERSELFHYAADEQPRFEPIFVDAAEVLSLVYTFDDYSAWAHSIVAQLPHVELWYEEDLLSMSQQQATARRLFEVLGLHTALDAQPKFVRVAPQSVRERVVNYEDLESTFTRTRFARFLER